MVVYAYIDAAYGVHLDCKSHTGVIVTFGENGTSYTKSAKQKIVTKSSIKAELFASSDSANISICMANFMGHQGYDFRPVVSYQDNDSAMVLINKGKSLSDLTKHILLRYFWVKEKINDETVIIVYCSIEVMTAKLLTKTVQGAFFN